MPRFRPSNGSLLDSVEQPVIANAIMLMIKILIILLRIGYFPNNAFKKANQKLA
jgi:hypothetical protein